MIICTIKGFAFGKVYRRSSANTLIFLFAAPLIRVQKSKLALTGLKQLISVRAKLAILQKSAYSLLLESPKSLHKLQNHFTLCKFSKLK